MGFTTTDQRKALQLTCNNVSSQNATPLDNHRSAQGATTRMRKALHHWTSAKRYNNLQHTVITRRCNLFATMLFSAKRHTIGPAQSATQQPTSARRYNVHATIYQRNALHHWTRGKRSVARCAEQCSAMRRRVQRNALKSVALRQSDEPRFKQQA